MEEVKEKELGEEVGNYVVESEHSGEEGEDLENKGEKAMHPQDKEEEEIMKKYGGILPKKKPLISDDHERVFFDSADWALGKQGAQMPKGPIEALPPKLQPTPHAQARSRRSVYAPPEDDRDDGQNPTSDDGSGAPDVEDDEKSRFGGAERAAIDSDPLGAPRVMVDPKKTDVNVDE